MQQHHQKSKKRQEDENRTAQGGVFDVDAISSALSCASDYSGRRDLAEAIRLREDCLERMHLIYGGMYPMTLSAIFRLACDYDSNSDFRKALSLHEDCLKKRRTVLGDSNTDTQRSIAALLEIKSKIHNEKKSESPYNTMKTKDLIELIDRRKLNRVGLQEKSELVDLLYSITSVVEKRGVTLKLFRAYRQLALSRNADASFWTIARVSTMINGNHEILKADGRFGQVDPNTTLTFADKCSLIEVLLRHFDSNNKHPLLNLSYKEAVGEKANLFVSFAYTDNFIDLVDALELYLETHTREYPVDTTYLWFDVPLNNQWTASDQTFEFWANIFRETVEEIGHTLCFLSPWESPSILTRVWCLLEMRHSPRISIILSRKEVSSFQNMLRYDQESIAKSLCKIKAENATSFKLEDKERIFRVIKSMEGGFHAFNVKIMGLIRDWIAVSARGIIAPVSYKSSSSSSVGGEKVGDNSTFTIAQLRDMTIAARILCDQGQFDEATKLYERALSGFEGSLGPDHDDTITAVNLLAVNLASKHGRFEEAKKLSERVLSVCERSLGPDHIRTLHAVNNVALHLENLGRLEEAKKLFERAVSGYERTLGPVHECSLYAIGNLANLLEKQGRIEEAKKLYERVLSGFERSVGPDHDDTLKCVSNLARLLLGQGQLEEAKLLFQRVLSGQERLLGPGHKSTLGTISLLASLSSRQGRFEEAEKLYERALSGLERGLGPGHESTLQTVYGLAGLSNRQGRFEEAKKLYERALSGQERALGPEHEKTLNTVHDLASLLSKQGRFEEARKLFERALSGFERIMGPDHFSTLSAVLNLATQSMHIGRVKEAKRLFERALSGFTQILGPNHMKTVMTSQGLASLKK